MKYKLNTLMIIGVFASSAISTTLFADSKHFTKATRSAEASYDFRVATMNIYKWYLSPMGAMAKGKVDYNQHTFSEYADELLLASKLDLLEGFPEDSGSMEVEDSVAKDLIWEKPKEFSTAFVNFQSEVQKLADIAKKGDEKAVKVQFVKAAKSCSACHKKFRSKK